MISTSSRTGQASPLNRDAPDTDLSEARAWVLHIQKKLHQWAKNDPNKRFDDLFNLVCHPTTLCVAWAYIRSNAGSRTAGVDGETRRHIERRRGGAETLLQEIRAALRARSYRPSLVRQHAIPKAGGKMRYLGIPTVSTYSGVAPATFRFARCHASIPPVEGPAAEHSVRAQASRRPPVRV